MNFALAIVVDYLNYDFEATSEVSVTDCERHLYIYSKNSLEGEGKGEFKVGNDWETYGQ